MTATNARRHISSLLLEWCDSLVRLQVHVPESSRLDGGILCPACGAIHGRCHEAVYPLLCAARLTEDKTYLEAARRLFDWGKNMQCADGAFRNDFKSDWKGVTVFAAIALHDALCFHGDLLSQKEQSLWDDRLQRMGAWLYRNLTESAHAYLNYHAANACAMALLGTRFSNGAYLSLAKRLAAYCMAHITENGLIFGEGSPVGGVSPKGCRPIDVGGYNTEETLPSLWRYACVVGDTGMQNMCRRLWHAHLDWMLPDGAWDDSTGTRAFKWTYWGSRTADGCQAALFDLGKTDAVFAEAAWRNFELYRRCTANGLLRAGPDDERIGEPACVHHTFCHAKVLATALDGGIPAFERTALPSDRPETLRYYPELNTFRAACGPWRMDVSGYDISYSGTQHATGGSLTLLWHKTAGPLVAVGSLNGKLREPHNQQLSVWPDLQRCGCPRLETDGEGARFGQHFCKTARLTAEETSAGPLIRTNADLCSEDGTALADSACMLEYRLTEATLTVTGRISPELSGRVCFVLPLIGESAAVAVRQGALLCPPAQMLTFSPGFLAKEYRIRPDADGCFRLDICVEPSSPERTE